MEFAWNTQKNKISDIKGKEKEQEREGKIRNKDIDLNKTHKNYDLVSNKFNLYQRIKSRIDDVRDNSRVQKNSVVSYSNVITVNKETHAIWGEEKTSEYFKEVYNYFCNEFGKENVVSAKVHLDETTPHMHLHFVPISKEGKLQARKVMTPSRINKIHSEAPKFLQGRGFDIVRGKGITHKDNIKDIHEYKLEKLIEEVSDLENKKLELTKNIKNISEIEEIKDIEVKEKKGFLKGSSVQMDINTYEQLISVLEGLRGRVIKLEKENFDLREDNNFYKKREEKIFSIKEKNHLLEINNTKRSDELDFRENQINLVQKNISLLYKEIDDERELIKKSNKKINDYKTKLEKEQEEYKLFIERDFEAKYQDEIEMKDKRIKFLESFNTSNNNFLKKLYSNNQFKEEHIDFLKGLYDKTNFMLEKYAEKYGTYLLDNLVLFHGKDFEYKNSYIKLSLDINGKHNGLEENVSFRCEDADKFIRSEMELKKYEHPNETLKMRYSLYNKDKVLIHMDESILDESYLGLEYLLGKQIKESKNLLIRNKDKDIVENIFNINSGLER